MDLERFKKDLQIDPGALDVAAVSQAEMFFKYAAMMVDAKIENDVAKKRLDMVEADVSYRIRVRARKEGTKPTESSIRDTVLRHPRYRKAVQRFFLSRRRSMLLDHLVVAMEQRKKMIDVLVTLHGQQYFCGPSTPRNLHSAYADYKRSQTESLNRVQRQRRRER